MVELGETRSRHAARPARPRARRPDARVGYWSDAAGAYLDDAGDRLVLPGPGSGRSATLVEREGTPFAVLVHDAAVLRDPALVDAVASATRLSASNVALRDGGARAGPGARGVAAAAARSPPTRSGAGSRRGLREGPEQRLDDLAAYPRRRRAARNERLERARLQLTRTLDDLHELARGLHPRELAEAGLPGALASLAERAPVPVELDVRVGRLPAELEATVYFVCAEALANVAKYASASSARIEVTAGDGRRAGRRRRRRRRRRRPARAAPACKGSPTASRRSAAR